MVSSFSTLPINDEDDGEGTVPLGDLSYAGDTPDMSGIPGTTGVEPWFFFVEDIVNVANGNLYLSQIDTAIPGLGYTITFERSYNSYLRERNSSVGYGWTHNYAVSLDVNSTRAVLMEGDGSVHVFERSGDDFTAPYGKHLNLTVRWDGSFRLRDLGGGIYAFDDHGVLQNITDKNGNQLTMTYTGGLLTGVYDDAGTGLDLAYTGGRVTKLTDPQLNREWTFTYTGGNLTEAADPTGNSTVYAYDTDRSLMMRADEVDRALVFTYEADAGENESYRVVTVENGVYNRTNTTAYDLYKAISLSYDPGLTTFLIRGDEYTIGHGSDGEWTNRTNPMGGTMHLSWDDGLLTSYKNEEDEEWTYTYGDHGTIDSMADPTGNTTYYNWTVIVTRARYIALQDNVTDRRGYTSSLTADANGNRNSSTGPLGDVSTTRFDTNGLITSFTGPDGETHYHNYSTGGRLVNSTNPNGGITEFTYDAAGRLLTERTPGGAGTTYSYDDLDRVTSVMDTYGNYTNFTYDPAGRLTSRTDALGYTYSYDPAFGGGPASVTGPDGNTTNYTYDKYGNPRLNEGPENETVRIEYDALERPVKITDPLGNVETYSYDAVGRVVRYMDAKGGVTRYEYDALGQLWRTTDAMGGTYTLGRDEEGNVVSETDQLGRTTEYQFDAFGLVVNVTDPTGNYTLMAYDEAGRLTTFTDALGGEVHYRYDAGGRLVSVEDQSGNFTNRTYDADGNPLTTTDPNGNVGTASYDLLGRLLRVTDPLGNFTRATYDALGRLTASYDGEDRKTTHSYDVLGRLERVVYPDASAERYEYDASGRVTRTVDGLNGSITHTYDAAGRVTSTTDASGNVTTFSHNAAGEVKTIKSMYRGEVRFWYDALGRTTRKIDRAGGLWQYEFDAVGNLLNITEPLGHTARTEYDGLGRAVKVTDASGNSTRFYYDPAGGLLKTVDALGRTMEYDRDDLGRPVTLTLPDGQRINRTYDANGNLVAVEDTLGRETRYGFDALDRMIEWIDPLNGTTGYGYDHGTRSIAWVLDPMNRNTSYEYDFRGRLLNITTPGNNVTRYTYDPAGNVHTRVDPDGRQTNYKYDELSRLTAVDYDDGSGFRYRYNSMGWMTTSKNIGTGEMIYYSYDNEARLTQKYLIVGSVMKSYSFSYDLAGNMVSMVDPQSGWTMYTYDVCDRLTRINAPSTGSINISYDALGRRTGMERPNGITTFYSYDTAGNLVNISAEYSNGTSVMRRVYGYDDMANVVSVEDERGWSTDHEYDALYRLVNASLPDGSYIAYAYNAAGDRTSIDVDGTLTIYGYSAAGRLISAGAVAYTYDASGNMVNRTDPGGTTNYTYDHENRLLNVTLYNGTGVNMTYSGTGELLTRTDWSGTLIFASIGEDIQAVYDSGGLLQSSTVHGPGVDDVIELTMSGTGTFQVHTDLLGSVVAYTNGTGAVAGTVNYLPFGSMANSTGFQTPLYLYTGRSYEAVSGLYHYRTRAYDPEVGRFTSVDPMSRLMRLAPDVYVYTGNNPVTFVDPHGFGRTPGPTLNINIRETNAVERNGCYCVSPYSLEIVIEIEIDYYITDVGYKNHRRFEEGGKWYNQADLVETIEHWKLYIFIWIGFKTKIVRDDAAIEGARDSADAARAWGTAGTVNSLVGGALGLIPGVGTVIGLVSGGIGMAIGAAQSGNYEDALAALEGALASTSVDVSYDSFVDVWEEYSGIHSEKVWCQGPKVEIPIGPGTVIGPHGPVVITPGGRRPQPRGPVPQPRPGPKPTPGQPVPTGGGRPAGTGGASGATSGERPTGGGASGGPSGGWPYGRPIPPFPRDIPGTEREWPFGSGGIIHPPGGPFGPPDGGLSIPELPYDPDDPFQNGEILWDPIPGYWNRPLGPSSTTPPEPGRDSDGGRVGLGGGSGGGGCTDDDCDDVVRYEWDLDAHTLGSPGTALRTVPVGAYTSTSTMGDPDSALFPRFDDWSIDIDLPGANREGDIPLVSPYTDSIPVEIRNDGDLDGTHDLYVRLEEWQQTDVVSEGFESGLPTGWAVYNRGSDMTGETWEVVGDNPNNGNSSVSVAGGSPAEWQEEWLITPMYDVMEWEAPMLGFYFDANSGSTGSYLYVYASDEGTEPDDFPGEPFLAIDPSEWSGYTGYKEEVTHFLDAIIDEGDMTQMSLAFVWDTTDQQDVWVDDIRINALSYIEILEESPESLVLDASTSADAGGPPADCVQWYDLNLDQGEGTYRFTAWLNATGIDDDPYNDIDQVEFRVGTLDAPTLQNVTADGPAGEDITLIWFPVPMADAYDVYATSDPDVWDTSPVATVNGTTWTAAGANDPGGPMYEPLTFYTVRAVNATGGDPGVPSRVAGKLTRTFGGGGHGGNWQTFSVPFQTFGTYSADDYCDMILNCTGISHYLVDEQVWEFHATFMPKGSTDWTMVPGETYMVALTSGVEFTFTGVSAAWKYTNPGLEAPAGFSIAADPVNETEVNVTWEAVVGASEYRVYRSTTRGAFDLANPTYAVTDDGSTTYYWTDVSAPNATEVFYCVAAYDGGGGMMGSTTSARGRFLATFNGSTDGMWNPWAPTAYMYTVRSADNTCDDINGCVGMSHYLGDHQAWEFHATEMPEGATDWEIELGDGYMVAVSGGGGAIYWYFNT